MGVCVFKQITRLNNLSSDRKVTPLSADHRYCIVASGISSISWETVCIVEKPLRHGWLTVGKRSSMNRRERYLEIASNARR